uniref:Uncharacterized protein n=1 Tax=Sphaerodactylus townsendi TaxID=933632 RepID=A0ACB8EGL1_9SAUR
MLYRRASGSCTRIQTEVDGIILPGLGSAFVTIKLRLILMTKRVPPAALEVLADRSSLQNCCGTRKVEDEQDVLIDEIVGANCTKYDQAFTANTSRSTQPPLSRASISAIPQV